jgi:hypothetical protein
MFTGHATYRNPELSAGRHQLEAPGERILRRIRRKRHWISHNSLQTVLIGNASA